MKEQSWIFSVQFWPEGKPFPRRFAVVGPARASTVEAALHLAGAPEAVRAEIRGDEVVRRFVDGSLDPEAIGYRASRRPYRSPPDADWVVCVGSIQEVLS
jgi:hypothetical protein